MFFQRFEINLGLIIDCLLGQEKLRYHRVFVVFGVY